MNSNTAAAVNFARELRESGGVWQFECDSDIGEAGEIIALMFAALSRARDEPNIGSAERAEIDGAIETILRTHSMFTRLRLWHRPSRVIDYMISIRSYLRRALRNARRPGTRQRREKTLSKLEAVLSLIQENVGDIERDLCERRRLKWIGCR